MSEVSVLVPTRDRLDLLSACIDSVRRNSDHHDIDCVVIDNASELPDTHAYLERLASQPGCRVIRFAGRFNFSAMCNRAVAACDSKFIVLLNNDTEVISGNWLSELLSLVVQPDVGCVGAKLLYPDGRIQHAGIVIGGRAMAHNALVGCPRDGGAQRDWLAGRRAVSAVSAACLVVRRELYLSIGGMDERLPVAYNDVDLCLKAEAAGYRNVFTPFAELYHLEGQSRGRTRTLRQWLRLTRDRRYLRRKWGSRLDHDPWDPGPPNGD